MTREMKAIIKTAFDIIDQISENISDLRERQEKIKIVLLSMLGTIIGLYAYDNYVSEKRVLEVPKKDDKNDTQQEKNLPAKPQVKIN